MDALNGLRLAQEGTVLYNGVDYYSNLAIFNTQLGYVPQEDIVHRDLTVERALYYAARLRLPSDFSGAIIPLKDWLTQLLATIFPTRWAMAALGSSIGLHADKTGGDRLFGDDCTYHSTLYSIYSQADALHRLLLCWGALMVLILVLMLLVGIFLKRKDIRA